MKCDHKWELLLPRFKSLNLADPANYIVDVMLAGGLMGRSVICKNCGRQGHYINSARGGVKLHPTNHFVIEANKILKDNGAPEHEIKYEALNK